MIAFMNSPATVRVLSPREAAAMGPEQVVGLSEVAVKLRGELESAKQQIEWFKRQLFGQKSERRLQEVASTQMSLGEVMGAGESRGVPAGRTVAGYTRAATQKKPADNAGESLPFFDEARVPVEVIEVPAPEARGLSPEQYDIIGHKDSYRLAQRPGSYVVLKYRRALVKLRESGAIACAPAPAGVIEGSRAEVSFVAGMLIDKFAYHLPLYRQHQRASDAGITVSRPWFTQIAQQAIELLAPVYEAQLASVRGSRIKAMDETPIKAGRAGPGKMKGAYFWPVYGELDEVCFPFFESRRHEHVEQALGLTHQEGAVLLSDGYRAYETYAQKAGITHAQCWAHCRRHVFEAQEAEPQAAAQGLDLIGKLYEVEEHIRANQLGAQNKLDYRLEHAKPAVEKFFEWVNREFESQGLLPSNPLTKALAYARERRNGLEVFLTDPDVPIDTNHLERALRAIPMGRNYPRSTIRQGLLGLVSEAWSQRRIRPALGSPMFA
jgi:transposase